MRHVDLVHRFTERSCFQGRVRERFETNEEAEAKTFDYIEVFYNRQRRHSAFGYPSPAEHGRAVQAELVA